uniref:Uncharacterized protein n=1 Tax=Arundo donax TaxID=35708 RepID=A0A0A9BV94_ARUDO
MGTRAVLSSFVALIIYSSQGALSVRVTR